MSYEVLIRLPNRPETVGRLVPGTYRIGSSPAAHLQINLDDVSPRHCLLTVKEDELRIQDAGSKSGTFVDGERIGSEPTVIMPGATIEIGESRIQIRDGGNKGRKPAPKQSDAGAKPTGGAARSGGGPPAKGGRHIPMLSISGIPYEYRRVVQSIKQEVHVELITRMNLKNLTLSGADYEQVREQARETIRDIVTERRHSVPAGIDQALVEKEITDEAVALGPLEGMLDNPDITEIMVNGSEHVFVEKGGTLYRTDYMFASDHQLLNTIERIVAPLGRRIDESQPLVDARLKDGSRVNAIIPPLAIDGPALTIRKFSSDPFTVDDLVGFGSLTDEIASLLQIAVRLRKNILISGGTGSGKTTLLNLVSGFIPNSERIVTIEDAAELRLGQDHVVRLEARPANIEGRGEITIRDLVRNSLRMRPDRIVVGECRGGEALDMLQAMNTGHDGSLTTVHANSSRDALARLETLVLMAGFDLPLRAIREQIAAAVAMIVQIGRLSDGSRKVLEVAEITGMEGEVITTQELFVYDQEGLADDFKVIGRHRACGMIPTFADELRRRGIKFDLSIFNEAP